MIIFRLKQQSRVDLAIIKGIMEVEPLLHKPVASLIPLKLALKSQRCILVQFNDIRQVLETIQVNQQRCIGKWLVANACLTIKVEMIRATIAMIIMTLRDVCQIVTNRVSDQARFRAQVMIRLNLLLFHVYEAKAVPANIFVAIFLAAVSSIKQALRSIVRIITDPIIPKPREKAITASLIN